MKYLHGNNENNRSNNGMENGNGNNENGKNGSLRALVASNQAALHKFSSKLGDVTVLSNKVAELNEQVSKQNVVVDEKLNKIINLGNRIPKDFINFCNFLHKETNEQKQSLLTTNKTALQVEVKVNGLSKKVTDLEQTMSKLEETAKKQQQKEKYRFYAVCIVGVLIVYINLLIYKQVYFTNTNLTPAVSDVVSPVNTSTIKVEAQHNDSIEGGKIKKGNKSKTR